ncbi:hypothetical protein [Hydrogenibacillus sp. N12]|uniref:hypothetical protein n=1 Tax=Hydrogenibacillus sp. N12 TaxID=2866627 RepID=UPI001C7DFE62|nr:hypothetical protein [Hydrogenibacillus sp. N12]QZA33768.1 hypothetical protein K2M58_04440 [Hydrogenibacillus sp. N12]
MFDVGGLAVGLIGLSYPHEAASMPPAFSVGLRFTDGRSEVPALVRALRAEGAELVIVLSHMGFPADAALLQSLPADGVPDIWLSAHSHDRKARPFWIGETPIWTTRRWPSSPQFRE